jgi:hypothetical protein
MHPDEGVEHKVGQIGRFDNRSRPGRPCLFPPGRRRAVACYGPRPHFRPLAGHAKSFAITHAHTDAGISDTTDWRRLHYEGFSRGGPGVSGTTPGHAGGPTDGSAVGGGPARRLHPAVARPVRGPHAAPDRAIALALRRATEQGSNGHSPQTTFERGLEPACEDRNEQTPTSA